MVAEVGGWILIGMALLLLASPVFVYYFVVKKSWKDGIYTALKGYLVSVLAGLVLDAWFVGVLAWFGVLMFWHKPDVGFGRSVWFAVVVSVVHYVFGLILLGVAVAYLSLGVLSELGGM